MKYPPAIDSIIFQDDGGWWRVRRRRNLTGRSKDEVAYWLSEIGEESIPPPYIDPRRFDTDHEAHIAALEDHIEDITDEYDPPLTVTVLDPDGRVRDTDDRLTLLGELRKEAVWAALQT